MSAGMSNLFLFSSHLGYPLALFYRHYLFYKDSYLIHLFHTFTGLSIAYFNFGKGVGSAGMQP
jgi:hypothetical protein